MNLYSYLSFIKCILPASNSLKNRLKNKGKAFFSKTAWTMRKKPLEIPKRNDELTIFVGRQHR